MSIRASSMWPVTLASACLAMAIAAGGQTPPRSPATSTSIPAGILELPSPAPAGAQVPNVAADTRGRVWLSWIEPRATGGHRFRIASIDPNASGQPAWSAPITVAEGDTFLVNWADFPSIFVTRSGTIAAHWLERGPARGEYGIRLRTSSDGGRTWTTPVTPHRDPSGPAEHGFVSFFDAPGAGLGLVWLDGRDAASHDATGHGGSMTLRSALVANGKVEPEQLVDPRVCDCCQTSVARTSDGVIVAYRDRSETEVRDIAVSRFRAGRWSAPALVHADDWQINGCPVNGPAVAASGDEVAVAWFSAKDNAPTLKVAFGQGDTFAAPLRLDSATTYGRLAMVMPSAGRVIVSSIERRESGPRLMLREARSDGRLAAPVDLAPMTTDQSSGFARMAVAGRRLVIAWTDVRPGASTTIQVRSVEIR